ncbi:metallophosphoesterase [Kribbella sp. NPDC051770]|uniref:metallophosphoesterase n=1 Tax=Kribbella sp. NPDC051770 TaxID=3155413 RepID=UPI00341B6921
MTVIAHLSDPHLDGTAEARDRLRRVTAYLLAFSRPVDVVLVTGDLADHGTEYAEVAAELAAFGELPVLVLPGNHDVRANFRAGLTAYVQSVTGGEDPVHQVRDVAGARFVLLDTTVPGEDHGHLSSDSLDWLDAALADPHDGPVFIAFHHPPVGLEHPTMDQWLLREPGQFASLLRRHPVNALFAGHLHNGISTSYAGLPLLLAPGIRSTVPLLAEPPSPTGSLVDPTAPPGLALHVHHPDVPLLTKFVHLA